MTKVYLDQKIIVEFDQDNPRGEAGASVVRWADHYNIGGHTIVEAPQYDCVQPVRTTVDELRSVVNSEQWDRIKGTDVISNPGKFDGCAIWAPALYNLSNESFSDQVAYTECGLQVDIFIVDDTMLIAYPGLYSVAEVAIYEDSQGFVHLVYDDDISELISEELDDF